jgi:general secretion pathway protein G
LEFAVFIVIFAVLATVLLDRFSYYQELAEKAAMDSMVRGIKTGLQIRLAELIIANRQTETGVLETEDPVNWLETKPPNYGGAYPEHPLPGTWYFDGRERQLVYVVNTGNRLEIDTGTGLKQLRFQPRLLRDRVKTSTGTVESVTGITLAPVRPYRWQ